MRKQVHQNVIVMGATEFRYSSFAILPYLPLSVPQATTIFLMRESGWLHEAHNCFGKQINSLQPRLLACLQNNCPLVTFTLMLHSYFKLKAIPKWIIFSTKSASPTKLLLILYSSFSHTLLLISILSLILAFIIFHFNHGNHLINGLFAFILSSF